MDIIKATLLMYWDCASLAAKGLARNWPILPGCVLLFMLYNFSSAFFSQFGFAGGMIAGMIQIALLCYFYSWISSTVQKERLTFKDLPEFDGGLFFNIISVAFIFFIVQFVLQQLTQGLDAKFLLMCVQLGIVIVFNAIPEVIYLHRIESTYALSEAARFTRDNWIEWFAPLLLVLAPVLLASPLSVLLMLAHSDPMLPPFIVVTGVLNSNFGQATAFLLPLLALLIAIWYMVFRGHLFQALSSGTRRQRMYKSKSR
ncbi:MAG: hypothetical protein J0M12_01615 [Deltaproteobacteria bacterium]|nr:hypothetical protein [Deltaproteobacteria bacterium]